eukprot:994660-Alexandrium_andersonii.AAC.1
MDAGGSGARLIFCQRWRYKKVTARRSPARCRPIQGARCSDCFASLALFGWGRGGRRRWPEGDWMVLRPRSQRVRA